MQCPSCGFENMPGIETCLACSCDLTPRKAGQSVFPPRAKNRTLRQRFRWGMGARLRRMAGNAELRERMANAGRVFSEALQTPTRIRPQTIGLALLSVVPGVGQALAGHPDQGRRILLGSLAALALAALLFRTPICDLLVYGVIGLSTYSVLIYIESVLQSNDPPARTPRRSVGIALLILAVYLGGYAFLRVAISPAIQVVTVINNPPLFEGLHDGDTLLVQRQDIANRGDIMLAEGQRGILAGPIVGVPGDVIRITDRIYVNGTPLVSPVWSMPEIAGFSVEFELPEDLYWLLPDVRWVNEANPGYAAAFLDAMAGTGKVDRYSMIGRVVAITSPPRHRTLVRPVPVIEGETQPEAHQ